jgi:DNA repair protein RadA/Sms
MAKINSHFVCQSCGSIHRKWVGKCEDCDSWNSLVEEAIPQALPAVTANFSGAFFGADSTRVLGTALPFTTLLDSLPDTPRLLTQIGELDRALGGGLVAGSAILIGGDPGIGKSTLLLQMVAKLASAGVECAYVSGEESVAQISLRARRLGVSSGHLKLLSATHIGNILQSLQEINAQVVVIDSIQTMVVDTISSASGSVSQVRAAASSLVALAKERGITVILVGHVTKDGQIAGPKLLEHMVDTVLYFEGERGHQFRIVRAVKNRFGSVNEIGVFEMRDTGLEEITNPSSLFLTERQNAIAGSAVFAGIEGTRPVLVEIQALVAPTMMATPRRAVVGWDAGRLAMIIAVLTARFGLRLGDKEVYLNVAGGLKIDEPAADLAVAAALISAARDTPLPQGSVWFGEIGLSGEVRAVSHSETRIKEAKKLGFSSCYAPANTVTSQSLLQIKPIAHIRQVALTKSPEREAEVDA